MSETLIKSLWIAWIPVAALLFRAIEPRRAVLIAVIGGVLFLPDDHLKLGPPSFAVPIDKWIATGLGLILGVLSFDRRSLSRFHPAWLDLPMVAYVLFPLIGLIVGGPGSAADVVEEMSGRGLGWFVPYAMGRIYFSQADGPSRVANALVIGGLAYLPFCLYEEVAGPPRYLAVLMYGTPFKEGMVSRLGGWRPEVFLGNGLAVSSWMSLTTVTATWLWLGKAWKIRGCPAWVPPLALLATTMSCRGVYGYLNLAIGLSTALLTRWLRTRAILVLLALVPFTYMGLRASGLWDGGLLVRGANLMDRASTISARLQAEDEIVQKVLDRAPIFGFGTIVYHAPEVIRKPDALWLTTLWMGGLAGLAVHMTTIFILPAIVGLRKPPGRPDRREAASSTWALACWCLLQMIEGLNNFNNFPATALINGTLIGTLSWKGAEVSQPWPIPGHGVDGRRPWPIPLVVSVIVLIGVEVLGRYPRKPSPSFNHAPGAPALENAPAEKRP